MDPGEPCIRWGPDPQWEGVILREKGRPVVKYRDTLRSSIQKRFEPIKMSFGLRSQVGPGNHVLDGGPDSQREGAILENRREEPIVGIWTFCRELCKNG